MTKALQKANSLEKSLRDMIGVQQQFIDKLEVSIDDENDTQSNDLISTLVKFGIGWSKTDVASLLARGQILYLFKLRWSKMPEKFTSQYDDSYDRFVQEQFMLSPSSAASQAEKWEALMSGRHCKIPKGVNIFLLNSGRLGAAAKLAIDGKLTTKKWDVLTSEGLTNRQVYGKLFRGKTQAGKPKRRKTQLLSSSGDIRLYDKKGMMKIVGYLDYSSGDPDILREVHRIIQSSGMDVVP